MAHVGEMLWGPGAWRGAGPNSAPATLALNDSDNAAYIIFEAPKTGAINRVGVTVTAENGTSPAYKVGLYAVDAAGAPDVATIRAEESATYTAAGSVWTTFSTPYNATAGELLAVGIRPGASAPDGSNNITIVKSAVVTLYSANAVWRYPACRSWTTGWTNVFSAVGIGCLYTDGTVAVPLVINEQNYGLLETDQTPDEIGIKLTLPFGATCVGAVWNAYQNATTDYTISLLDSADSAVATQAVDASAFGGNAADAAVAIAWAPVALSAGATYRLIVSPASASAGVRYFWLPTDSASISWFPFKNFYVPTQRTDGGAWDDTETYRIPSLALILSDIDFGARSHGSMG